MMKLESPAAWTLESCASGGMHKRGPLFNNCSVSVAPKLAA